MTLASMNSINYLSRSWLMVIIIVTIVLTKSTPHFTPQSNTLTTRQVKLR